MAACHAWWQPTAVATFCCMYASQEQRLSQPFRGVAVSRNLLVSQPGGEGSIGRLTARSMYHDAFSKPVALAHIRMCTPPALHIQRQHAALGRWGVSHLSYGTASQRLKRPPLQAPKLHVSTRGRLHEAARRLQRVASCPDSQPC